MTDFYTRYHIDLADLMQKLDEIDDPPELDTLLAASSDVYGKFLESQSSLTALHALLMSSFNVSRAITQLLAESTKENLVELCSMLAAIRSSPVFQAMSPEAQAAVAAVVGSHGIRECGKTMYDKSVAHWRSTCEGILRDTVSYIRDAAPKPPDGAIITEARGKRHLLCQQASWSISPVFDRKSIEFMCSEILAVCANISDVVAMTELSKASSKKSGSQGTADVNVDVYRAVRKVLLAPEDSKPILQWLLNSGGLMADVLKFMSDISDVIAPAHQTKIKGLVDAVTVATQKVQGFLADDKLNQTDFFASFSPKTMQQLRTARSALVAAADALDKNRDDPNEKPKEVTAAEDLAKRARNQTVRYGFLAFLGAAAIRTDSQEGLTARTNLRSVWDAHKLDKDICQYLGQPLCTDVQSLLNDFAHETEAAAKRARARAIAADTAPQPKKPRARK